VQIIDPIHIDLNPERIARRLHLKREPERRRLASLLVKARQLIAARAVFRPAYVVSRSESGVVVEDQLLRSTVVRRQLEGIERIFPYVITIGQQMENEGRSLPMLEQFFFDGIANAALAAARGALQARLQERYGLDGLSSLAPGSLPNWPLEEQRRIFALLGPGPQEVGVRLTENCLMVPAKSISGFFYPSRVPFFSCQLCPRPRCPGRKAAYDEHLAKQYADRPPEEGR
jgi:hypothetical protein